MGKIDMAIKEMIRDSVVDEMGDVFCAEDYVSADEAKEIVTDIINDMMVEDICALSTLENHERCTYEEIDKLKGRIYDIENPPTVWASVKNIVSRLFIARKVS